MSFLQLENKKYLVFGVFNKKSIAYYAAKTLIEEGAEVILSVRDEHTRKSIQEHFPKTGVFVCNIENQDDLKKLAEDVSNRHGKLDGMLHSIAFADFSEGFKPFHETKKEHFLQAIDISCFSLINISNVLKDLLNKDASVITLSVPFTKVAVENYSYMAPVKAALESSVVYLAKSFSHFSHIRFNALCLGFLKTSAAAGIPKFMKYYAFSEKLTFRKRALDTAEVGNIIAFMLSNKSSAINAQTITADAGLSVNWFDEEIVDSVEKTLFS